MTSDGSQQDIVEEEETSDPTPSERNVTEEVIPEGGGHGPQGQPTLTEIEAAFERLVWKGRLHVRTG